MVQSKARRAAGLTRWLVGGYGMVLAALILLRLTIGDRAAILFELNALLLYGFAPLPCVLAAGVALRRADVLAVSGLGALAWCGFWGELFVPRTSAAPGRTKIVVLSYNALGFSRAPADTVSIVRGSHADLVALQELNPETAALIERELGAVYPYRWLDPRAGVTGGGILSKHPLTRATPETIPGSWVGTPMVARVDVSGTELTFVRFHASAGSIFLHRREEQARVLAAFAESRRARPLIVAGDLNATDQNGAYAIVTRHLRDAWREAGWGFGHTFPGEPTPEHGGSRPTLLGVPVPMWLVRIDFIFYSDALEAVEAQLAPYSGGSDHRGVIATLALP